LFHETEQLAKLRFVLLRFAKREVLHRFISYHFAKQKKYNFMKEKASEKSLHKMKARENLS
jgi:hypothetical protein